LQFISNIGYVFNNKDLKMKKQLLLLFIAFTVVSCNILKVSYDYDKTVKFDTYKTFMFTEGALRLPIDETNKGIILKAVEDELIAKGFTKSDYSDVLIDLKISIKQSQSASATNTPDYYGYGLGYNYGYGAGYPYTWSNGFSTTQIDINKYSKGTLFIDMIDAKKLQLVWQGRAKRTIAEDVPEMKREENINFAVKKVFTQYPPKLK
jgi:hypothetical protein